MTSRAIFVPYTFKLETTIYKYKVKKKGVDIIWRAGVGGKNQGLVFFRPLYIMKNYSKFTTICP